MLERGRMPLILWATPIEYGDLLSALGADPFFHEILRRVVVSHQNRNQSISFCLSQDDAAQVASDLDVSDFDGLADLIAQISEQLEWNRRNDAIFARRFALPQVGSFFGD